MKYNWKLMVVLENAVPGNYLLNLLNSYSIEPPDPKQLHEDFSTACVMENRNKPEQDDFICWNVCHSGNSMLNIQTV